MANEETTTKLGAILQAEMGATLSTVVSRRPDGTYEVNGERNGYPGRYVIDIEREDVCALIVGYWGLAR